MFSAIKETMSILDVLQKQERNANVYKPLRDLLKSLSVAIEEIDLYIKSERHNLFKSKTKLCASQLVKTLPNLVNAVRGSHGNSSKQIMDFLIDKIRWCLQEVLRLSSGGGSDDDSEPSGMFVKIMDDFYRKLTSPTLPTIEIDSEFKSTIDELLCQALTIAKLSESDDCNEISASCKNVLRSLSDLKENSTLCKDDLLCFSLQVSLEKLERNVNVAVLRLFLHLGACPNYPLKQLTLKALARNDESRTTSDLSDDLELLDLYCERIQLLGHFAVACSNDSSLKLKILCCLASIEFCENFFHQGGEEFYLSPQDHAKKSFFKFITDEYMKEVKELTLLIDCVVDTCTFVQVAFDDLKPLALNTKTPLTGRDISSGVPLIELFLARCIRLSKHLHSAQDETFTTDPKLSVAVKDFHSVLKQLHTNLQQNLFNQNRRQKLVDLMEASLSAVESISTLIESYYEPSCSIEATLTCKRRQTPLATPKTGLQRRLRIKQMEKSDYEWAPSCPSGCMETPMRPTASRQISNMKLPTSTPMVDILDPYLAKVRETPRLKSSLYVVTPRKTPRCLPLSAFDDSYSISGILSDIGDFPDTFAEEAPTNQSKCPADGTKRLSNLNMAGVDVSDLKTDLNPDLPLLLNWEEKSSYQSKLSVDSAQLNEDLLLLDDKINKLKSS